MEARWLSSISAWFFSARCSLRARQNDTLRVTVQNLLHEEVTSLHWHGLHMKNNAWQDGTPGITDCGILPHETRVFEFLVTQTGTYWYHAHSGAQYSDGLLGPIILDPSDEQHTGLSYNEDYILMLQDWVNIFSVEFGFAFNKEHSIMKPGET